jgi:hypothetical protein
MTDSLPTRVVGRNGAHCSGYQNICLAGGRTPTEKQMLPRQIETTDDQIDALVYELYGLTEEEVRIVEEE